MFDPKHLDALVLFVIGIVSAPVAAYAFIHALRQRADAFTAVGKLTKNAWLGITGAAVFFMLVDFVLGWVITRIMNLV